jgi:hypothetical protein
MNIRELKKILRENKIPRGQYTFNKDYDDMTFCLNSTSEGWEVYYCERGSKFGLQKFITEDGACQYLANELMRTQKLL